MKIIKKELNGEHQLIINSHIIIIFTFNVNNQFNCVGEWVIVYGYWLELNSLNGQ